MFHILPVYLPVLHGKKGPNHGMTVISFERKWRKTSLYLKNFSMKAPSIKLPPFFITLYQVSILQRFFCVYCKTLTPSLMENVYNLGFDYQAI